MRGRALGSISIVLVAIAMLGQAAPALPPHAGLYSEYAVAADHPLASDAGREVLAAGGNAADAAAAAVLALGVASPASSGLGGGGFALYYRASDRSLTFLDFRETAPAASSATMFARREGDDDATAAQRSQTGGLAVAVPGEPAGIEALITRFGSGHVTRAAVASPAERLAREGFAVSRYVSEQSATMLALLRTDRLLSGFVPEGADRIARGSVLRNPALAATLRTFGRQGARAFYRGSIAQQIVDAVAARGGILTRDDLAGYAVRERVPLEGTYFGRRWVTAPPPSAGGFTMLHSLALLERWQPDGGWRDGPAFRHALTQSWIGAFLDRAAYLGDPDHADIPVNRLLAGERMLRRAAIFDPERARAADDWEAPIETAAGSAEAPREGGTSHVCVVDAEGNIASITTTVNLQFGARISAGGFILNDEMDDFAREVGAPNAFGLPGGEANLPRAGRRPISTMSPTIVFDGDGAGSLPALCVGASGGSRIVTAAEQVALFALLFDEPMGEAVARRRVHQQGRPGTTMYERGLDAGWVVSLWRRGHDLDEVEGLANVQAIRIVRGDGTIELHAASDPRKDGEPRGR